MDNIDNPNINLSVFNKDGDVFVATAFRVHNIDAITTSGRESDAVLIEIKGYKNLSPQQLVEHSYIVSRAFSEHLTIMLGELGIEHELSNAQKNE